ncbi:hypothetical protein [Mycolicibacterium sediminis]|uniref:Transmembrane protein n=1 Tax=Mycolicibacterium sediminis TaxID=1286180 RepID=A0A7I7QPQ3_9MYCO|nr:hypothetical protein [Mycolicibacterium sediminis]BBY27947.1 hypothetical protein MSEDJ_20430 [Mycolicibacterium sediminis]
MTTEREPDEAPTGIPEDVVTGFWLWLVALPLMVAGYVVDLVTAPDRPWIVTAFAGFSAVVIAAISLALLSLLRQGYRWARTLLTGGGAASVVYVVGNLFSVDRPEAAAPVYAGCTIIGSVLIAGGAYLLHRKDAHAYFVR